MAASFPTSLGFSDAISIGPYVASTEAGPSHLVAMTPAGGAGTTLFHFPAGAQMYLEATLQNAVPASTFGGAPAFAIGVVFGDVATTRRNRMPGWDIGAIGLHSDDGRLFDQSGSAADAATLCLPFHAPGRVAGIGLFSAGAGGHELVFTVDGARVYTRALAATADVIAKMTLAVGLIGQGVQVHVNAGQEAFRYAAAARCPVIATAPAAGLPPPMPLPFNPFAPAPVPAPAETLPGKPALLGAAAPGDAALLSLIERLPSDTGVRAQCAAHGVGCMSVAWEDTARTKGSCFGPNISDMTLACHGRNMPIFRRPNFADLTSDQPLESFWLVVGNEAGSGPGGWSAAGAAGAAPAKRSIPLSEYLTDIGKYAGDPRLGSLLAPTTARDAKVLCAAQACVLPLRDGRVEFNVRLYNYQSQAEPAVLVVVASSEGTSAQVVMGRDNLLRFNKAGGAADFVAERLTDDRIKRGVPAEGPMTADERKRNCLLIFQVPLKVKAPPPTELYYGVSKSVAAFGGGGCKEGFAAPCAAAASSLSSSVCRGLGAAPARGLEAAMLSTSEARGAFFGTRGFVLERDATMPIRCTLQYYSVTDTAALPAPVVAAIAGQVSELYDASAPWNRGSLVTGGASGRVTEHSAAGTSIFGPGGWPRPMIAVYPGWYWGFRV